MCLWVLLPLAWVLMLSLKTLQDGAHNWIWPRNGFIDPILDNYDFVLNNPRRVGPVWAVFKNSVLVTSLTVIAATITSVLAGYALVHLKTPAQRLLTQAAGRIAVLPDAGDGNHRHLQYSESPRIHQPHVGP